MDQIWDRKSFEVVGHWALWRMKKQMTTQNRQKSNAKKTLKKNSFKAKVFGIFSITLVFITNHLKNPQAQPFRILFLYNRNPF